VTFVYAGEWAGDVLYRTQGAAANVQVTITTSADEPATLYTDATKDTPLGSNVVDTDSLGNLAFFADPGTYTCTAGTASFPAVVAVNPLEPSEGGGGAVTSVAVESANGLAGTVADAATTPQVTLSTTVTGVLKGSSGALVAATAGTDYLAPSGSGAALTGITAAQVGADASGAAATAQTNAETFATSAVATESSRAEAAEALKAPLASPALTGTPTAPTASALADDTQVATTAYADSAVAVEKTRAEGAESTSASAIAAETSRAEAAEALLAPKASPALTGTPTAPTASALTDSTQLATTAYTDSAVAVETSRAETAEALKAPLASPALTGTPTAPTQSASDNSTKLATTAYVTTAVKTGAQAAPTGFTPGNPTGTTSITLVMMGLGSSCTYTPAGSGLVVVNVTGQVGNVTGSPADTIGPRYGTGTPPGNGASVTGTRFGTGADFSVKQPGIGQNVPFAFTALLALTPATGYWFDLALLTGATGDEASIVNVSMTIFELA